jgi:hypothetical protein
MNVRALSVAAAILLGANKVCRGARYASGHRGRIRHRDASF